MRANTHAAINWKSDVNRFAQLAKATMLPFGDCMSMGEQNIGGTCSNGSSIWRELTNEVTRRRGDVDGQSGPSAVRLISI